MAFKLKSQSPLKQDRPAYEKVAKPYYSAITDAEDSVNRFLDKPMAKARKKKESYEKRTKGDMTTSDSVNHAAAGMYTRKAIAKKLGGGVLGNAVGVAGANILGVGHELSAFNSDHGYWNGIVEAGKDIVNNAIGSVSNEKNVEQRVKKYGTSGMSDAEKKERLKYIKEEKEKTKSPAKMKKAAPKKQMITRADGSKSQRGLWDNIRANKGSGKKPTKQMLVQAKKITSKKK